MRVLNQAQQVSQRNHQPHKCASLHHHTPPHPKPPELIPNEPYHILDQASDIHISVSRLLGRPIHSLIVIAMGAVLGQVGGAVRFWNQLVGHLADIQFWVDYEPPPEDQNQDQDLGWDQEHQDYVEEYGLQDLEWDSEMDEYDWGPVDQNQDQDEGQGQYQVEDIVALRLDQV